MDVEHLTLFHKILSLACLRKGDKAVMSQSLNTCMFIVLTDGTMRIVEISLVVWHFLGANEYQNLMRLSIRLRFHIGRSDQAMA